MEAENFLESSLTKYENMGCYNSEWHNFNLHNREKIG
jgi:hypothetical protein